jgi:hypothetical protein
MRDELKFVLYCVALGMTLIAYAHANFASKDILILIFSKLQTIESKILSLEEHLRR